MMLSWLLVLAIVAAVGSSLVAGTFFAFSVFIMRALARLPVPQGIAAMKSINRTVLNALFLGVFVGTAWLSLVIFIGSLMKSAPDVKLFRWASLVYLFGTFVVTISFNVPLNNSLDKVDPEHGAEEWARYLKQWTRWNHLRTVAATTALVLFILGFLELPVDR